MPEYVFRCDDCDTGYNLFCKVNEYDDAKDAIVCESCSQPMYRDFAADNIMGFISLSLSDCKTLGEYADKQRDKMGPAQAEERRSEFKTKQNKQVADLPAGMTRVDKPSGPPTKWVKDD